MKKSSFVALVLGTIGMLFFGIGMCMSLLPEWNMEIQGRIIGIVGAITLLTTLFIWRKMEGKDPIKVNPKTILTIVIAVVGALMLGGGMSMVMVFHKMIQGMILGIAGLFVLILLIPMTKGIRD